MGTFFGPPIRVGLPLGLGAGFKKAGPAPSTATIRVTATADQRVTATGDVRVIA